MGDDRYYAEIIREQRSKVEKAICDLIADFESASKMKVASVSLIRDIQRTGPTSFKMSEVGDQLIDVLMKVEL